MLTATQLRDYCSFLDLQYPLFACPMAMVQTAGSANNRFRAWQLAAPFRYKIAITGEITRCASTQRDEARYGSLQSEVFGGDELQKMNADHHRKRQRLGTFR